MEKQTTYWAVKAKGPHNNEIVANALEGSPLLYRDEITLNTGENIKGVWEVPSHAYINDFMRTKKECHWDFDFEIFSKTGKGKWHRTPYLGDLKKKPSPQEIKAAKFAKMAQERKVSHK